MENASAYAVRHASLVARAPSQTPASCPLPSRSNGMSKAFGKALTWDHIRNLVLPDIGTALGLIGAWIE